MKRVGWWGRGTIVVSGAIKIQFLFVQKRHILRGCWVNFSWKRGCGYNTSGELDFRSVVTKWSLKLSKALRGSYKIRYILPPIRDLFLEQVCEVTGLPSICLFRSRRKRTPWKFCVFSCRSLKFPSLGNKKLMRKIHLTFFAELHLMHLL